MSIDSEGSRKMNDETSAVKSVKIYEEDRIRNGSDERNAHQRERKQMLRRRETFDISENSQSSLLKQPIKLYSLMKVAPTRTKTGQFE